MLGKALNYGYEIGQLSVTQRRGIIKLLPKKDTVPYYIKNWWPISLLNRDYKIATKAIANRIKTVIPKIINYDQTGFIKGRFIGENIRLIDSLINFCAEKNTPGLLLFLDFEKAFDTLEWPFIRKVLQASWFWAVIDSLDKCLLQRCRKLRSEQWMGGKFLQVVPGCKTRLSPFPLLIHYFS